MMSPLHVVRQGASVELMLHRPDRRNALSRELVEQLTQAVACAATDPDVRCLVLTGAPPAFCAGLDLQELAAAPPHSAEPDLSPFRLLLETIDHCPKPVVAAVNGPALAGGAALVTACDIVVLAASATLGYPGIRHGLIAPIVLPYLLRAVAERSARCLLLTGEPVSAARAVALGLADEMVADAELLARARCYAALLAVYSPATVRDTKAALLARRLVPRAEGNRDEGPPDLRFSDESRAGVQRFLET